MGKKDTSASAMKPPVVAVLGHVDHGKTSLLDHIRATSVAAGEDGGITQHIGAYRITVKPKDKKSDPRPITFIDTPGHEAFAAMRSRGATVADIAILVVAADDSVKPQTIESIGQIREAKVPLIVAINKIDLDGARVDQVKSDLAKNGVQVEGFGGDVPVALVSAKTGKGVQELLELILLVSDMNGIPYLPEEPLEAVVVETRLDKGKGIVATLIIKKGTLKYASPLFHESTQIGKVRAMFDENGGRLTETLPGMPVEVMGYTTQPEIGWIIGAAPSQPAPTTATHPKNTASDQAETGLPDFLKPLEEAEGRKLTVVVKADTAGTLEAITAALPDNIKIVGSGVGMVTEADVLHARSTKSFVIGFNVKVSSEASKLAETEKVVVRTYTIIYKLIDELTEVAEGIEEVITGEREVGMGTIIAEFPFNDQRVAGIRVQSGRLVRGDRVKFMRNDAEFARARIRTIRKGKDEVNKVEEGQECGVLFERTVDFLIGDDIIAVS